MNVAILALLSNSDVGGKRKGRRSTDMERMRGFVTDVPLGDEVLSALGLRVVRFRNDEVVREGPRWRGNQRIDFNQQIISSK